MACENKNENEASFSDTASVTEGPYAENYATLDEIGMGAFGRVKLAYNYDTKKMYVVKFVRKDKILEDQWTSDEDGTRIPTEIFLLRDLSHPNVIALQEVYENSNFYQMVMEKHGSGMDLFDFVDRDPVMDEPLISYIFRQVVRAVEFLQSNNILHRDIKDENVIMNENFQIKLIDFGSATYFTPGQTFRTFYGTIAFCSPEVLMGNPYEGPELEMWSLGVLLYVLVFQRNPFSSHEKTIQCKLKIPSRASVSQPCLNLITSMLTKCPQSRLTLPELSRDIWLNQDINISDYRLEDVIPSGTEDVSPPISEDRNPSDIPDN